MKGKKLSICHVNVRSLLSQTRLLDLEILTGSHCIDILCLSETWLSPSRAPLSSNIALSYIILQPAVIELLVAVVA